MKKVIKWIITVILVLILVYAVLLLTNDKVKESFKAGYEAGQGISSSQVL